MWIGRVLLLTCPRCPSQWPVCPAEPIPHPAFLGKDPVTVQEPLLILTHVDLMSPKCHSLASARLPVTSMPNATITITVLLKLDFIQYI